jgi:hypothetical protein
LHFSHDDACPGNTARPCLRAEKDE